MKDRMDWRHSRDKRLMLDNQVARVVVVDKRVNQKMTSSQIDDRHPLRPGGAGLGIHSIILYTVEYSIL